VARERTPAELERLEADTRYKLAVASALEAMSPALEAPGDPPVRDTGLVHGGDGAGMEPLVVLGRVGDDGRPGSSLHVSARDFQGKAYVLVHVEFFANAFLFRTRGVAVQASELAAVGRALLEYAERVSR
jgi:hypothetical protein